MTSCWLAVAGCAGSPDEQTSAVRTPVVYGDDDRREPFASTENDWLPQVIATRLVALGFRDQIARNEGGVLSVTAPSLAERFDVCASEPFAAQPSFANCSAVLVTERLLLTAGHCARISPLKEQIAVRNFAYDAPERLHPLDPQDVLSLGAVVASDDYWDYAWLELAEPVAPLQPLELAEANEGMAIVGVNHGQGLPAKVAASRVSSAADGFFFSALDAFGGASGGPVFSTRGALLGISTSGNDDYVRTVTGCYEDSRLPDEAGFGAEQALRLRVALDGLCEARLEPSLCSNSRAASDDAKLQAKPERAHLSCALRAGAQAPCGASFAAGALLLGAVLLGLRRRSIREAAR